MAITKAQEVQQAFLQALQADSWESFLQFIEQHLTRKGSSFSLQQMVQALPKKDRYTLCAGLEHQVDVAIEKLTEALELEEDSDADQQEQQLELACQSLKAVAQAASVVLSDQPRSVPDPLLQCAAKLHDHALLAASDAPELQEATAQLCLSWWVASAPGRERLVPQTLPYLLVQALTTGKTADVKKCHTMRSALELLDFEDESIADVRLLLVRAMFCPAFLRVAEGRRFLSFLFTLQAQLVQELGSVIRNQVPSLRRSILDAYGEVLHRGWRDSSGGCQLAVEHFVQEMAQAAIHASTLPMAAALRRLLTGFHKHKAAAQVDSLLLRLYQPILFRAFSAANPGVRLNALALLVDVFPLQVATIKCVHPQNPHAPNEETDELLASQFTTLGACLGDGAPAVRAEAVGGVCHLLDLYWEVMPAATSAAFLKRLTGELLLDAASAAVRCAVLEGLALLCHNPLSHALLKAVLPQVGSALHDTTLKVRVALTELLLAIGATSGLHFLEVVDLEVLVAALADDSPQVTERIQRLLQPSYWPSPEEGPALVAALLRQSPEAGASFCAALAGTLGTPSGPRIPVEELQSLVGDLRDHLLACLPTADPSLNPSLNPDAGPNTKSRRGNKRKARGGKAQHKEDAPAEEQAETPADWKAILVGFSHLCQGLACCHLEEASAIFQGNQLLQLYEAAMSCQAHSHVLSLAAALPDEEASGALHDRVARCLFGRCGSQEKADSEVLEELRIVAAVQSGCRAAYQPDLQERLVAAAQDPEEAGQAALFIPLMLTDPKMKTVLSILALQEQLLPALKIAAASSCTQLQASLHSSLNASSTDASAVVLAYCKTAVHVQLMMNQQGERTCEAQGEGDVCAPHAQPQEPNARAGPDLPGNSALEEMSRQAGDLLPRLHVGSFTSGVCESGDNDTSVVTKCAAALVYGVLALSADAAMLLKWHAHNPAAVAACMLASGVLKLVEGSACDDSARVEVALLGAKLIANLSAGTCSTTAHDSSPTQSGNKADDTVSAAGHYILAVIQSQAQIPNAFKAVLPSLLSTLCACSHAGQPAGWMLPLVEAAQQACAAWDVQGSADSSKENMPDNPHIHDAEMSLHPPGSRKQAKYAADSSAPDPTAADSPAAEEDADGEKARVAAAFLRTVCAAAQTSKVQATMQTLALKHAAAAWQQHDLHTASVAVQLAAQMTHADGCGDDSWQSHAALIHSQLRDDVKAYAEAASGPFTQMTKAMEESLFKIRI